MSTTVCIVNIRYMKYLYIEKFHITAFSRIEGESIYLVGSFISWHSDPRTNSEV